MKRQAYILLLILITPVVIFCQQYNFTNFSLDEGLAQSQSYVIYEDSRGYLWIGTEGGGVNMFDGRKFANYTIQHGLCDNVIRTVFEDSRGNMWFGSKNNYLSVFNGTYFKNYNSNHGLEGKFVTAVTEDKKGTVLIGTLEHGLYYFINDSFIHIPLLNDTASLGILSLFVSENGRLWIGTKRHGIYVNDKPALRLSGDAPPYFREQFINLATKHGLANNQVNHITEDAHNNIWIATKYGASKFNGTSFTNYYQSDGLPGNNITSIELDHNDDIWFACYGQGVCKLRDGKFTYFTHQNGLASNNVLSIIQDRSLNMWFSTDGGGILKFSGERFKHFTKKDGLPSELIYALIEDRMGNVWMGTKGNGVCKYNGENFTYYNKSNGLCSDLIYTIAEDMEGNIWFGSKDNGISKFDGNRFYNYNNSNGLSENYVKDIIADTTGNIWIGTYGGGICIFDGARFYTYKTENGLSSNFIYAIFEDSMGNIWIGTDDAGVDMIFAKTGSRGLIKNRDIPDESIINISKNIGLSSNQVMSITEDHKGNIWFGTLGNGINKFDGKNLVHYTVEEGLNSNIIYLLLADSRGFLWAGTERGINRLNFNTRTGYPKVATYGKRDGFTGIETNLNAVIEDSTGNIWFGTVNGATVYDYRHDFPNVFEPQTHILNVRLNFREIDWTEYADSLSPWWRLPVELSLPYDQNHLTFEFAGIDLKAPEKVKYRWILEGFDKSWSPVSENQKVSYNYIPYGKYVFKVKAVNSQGIWSKNLSSINFTIKPPFWKTWWFYTLLILCSTAGIVLFIRLRLKKLRKDKEVLEEMVKIRTILLEEEKLVVEQQREELKSQAEHLAKVNKELEKLSIVASETDNAVIIAEKNGKIEWVNQAFSKLFGYTPEEYIQKNGDNILDASNHPEIQEIVEKCINEKKSVFYDTENIKKNGDKIWVQTTLTPILDDDKKEIVKLVAIDSDITKLKEQEKEIQMEKEKSEKLLLNILPETTAHELKERGTAEPRNYRFVSIMFTDFKGFTRTCEGLSPQEIVEELHMYFAKFDAIMEKHFLEKIKTIGDAYMCAGGLPIRNKSNPVNCILAAMEIVWFMNEMNKVKREKDMPVWELRIGIHTGRVIAGVVGIKKMMYDIWGDSVNIASRMESVGEVGKINISEATYEHIKDYFDCTYRGKIEVKNKGKIDMYYVNRILPELSKDESGFEPNEKFEKLIAEL